jgi:nitroreductase
MSDPAPPAFDLFEAIHTARAQRRLRAAPVPEALITRVLDAAVRAPSAGNAQNWHFVVVRDAEQRSRVGALYRKASDIAEAVYRARSHPAHLTEAQWHRMLASGAHLWDHMGDAPVLLVPCLHQRDLPARDALDPAWRDHYDAERAYLDRIRGASIYPAVQNVILACRALGLGTVITTNHLRIEAEFKALLGIPDDVDTFALMPIGWPEGRFGPLSRRPLAEVVHADHWSGAWPG